MVGRSVDSGSRGKGMGNRLDWRGQGWGTSPRLALTSFMGATCYDPASVQGPQTRDGGHLRPTQAASSLRLSGSSSVLLPENPSQPFTPFLMG